MTYEYINGYSIFGSRLDPNQNGPPESFGDTREFVDVSDLDPFLPFASTRRKVRETSELRNLTGFRRYHHVKV